MMFTLFLAISIAVFLDFVSSISLDAPNDYTWETTLSGDSKRDDITDLDSINKFDSKNY